MTEQACTLPQIGAYHIQATLYSQSHRHGCSGQRTMMWCHASWPTSLRHAQNRLSRKEPNPGQPYRLRLLQAMGVASSDPDMALLPLLETGVPTGAISQLPRSFQWPLKANSESTSPPFEICDQNWKNAESEPEVVKALLEKEIASGWVVRAHCSEAEAHVRWPKGVAVGKLNVVFADNKEPRLVLDSTVCNVNPRCHLPEQVSLPMASDLCLATHCKDAHSAFIGASFDFKAAHKQIQVHPDEHGLLLFRFQGELCHYRVCHFGGRFSAFWWQRTGAFMLRLMHGLLAMLPHKAWLFVDDLLAALCRSAGGEQLAIMAIFFCAISAPISWKKAQFQDQINWCGWSVHFGHDTIHLMKAKLDKLRQQLENLSQAHKVPRKALEQCLGLLIWATRIFKHLRPWLARCTDLHSPPGSMYSVSASTWQDSTGRATRAMPGLWIPTLARVIECSGKPVRCRADLPAVPASHKPTWVRISDPNSPTVTLRKDSKVCLNWLSRCFASAPTVPLALPPLLPCLAAADACAEGDTVGIGGWFLTSNAFAWFGETWSMSDIRQTWPFRTKPAQRYIACFETIAQFALLQIAHATSGQGHYHFTLPSGTENSATEADINKMFTTSWPMQVFLQLIASWAHSHNVVLQPTHIAGSANGWADDLSRNRLSRFANQSQHRHRFTPENVNDSSRRLTLHPADAPWRPEHRAATGGFQPTLPCAAA